MVDDEQKDQIKKTLEEKNIKLSPQEEEELYYNKYSIIKIVEVNKKPSKRSPKSISARATTPKVWYLMYRCFIPDKYIPNPTYNVPLAPGNQYAWFGGDNRTFTLSESESRYRTKTLVTVSVGDAGKSVGLSKNIGTSHGYDANYNLIGQKTDTDEGIYVTNVNTSVAGQISFTLYHASNNPLIAGSPDIDYYYDGIFNSSGKYSISGSHDQMPHHEFNIKLPGATSYTKGFHHTLVSPWYLEPPYPDAYFTISN
jgi:hypothetical protein